MSEKQDILLKIGKVSKIIGISSKRIIEYEKFGLIKPDREENTKDRLFSKFEIDQIKRIYALIHDHGFTLTSIVYFFQMTPCYKIWDCNLSKCNGFKYPKKKCWEITQMNKGKYCEGVCEKCPIYLTRNFPASNIPILQKPNS